MGNGPSSQRGGKAAQSETTLKESTPMDTAQVIESRPMIRSKLLSIFSLGC